MNYDLTFSIEFSEIDNVMILCIEEGNERRERRGRFSNVWKTIALPSQIREQA